MKRITCIFMVSLLVLTMLFCACEESGGKTAVDLTVNEAIELLNNGKYEEAYAKFFSIKNSADVSAYLDRFVWVCTGEKYTNHSGTFTRSTEYICNDYGYVMTAVESDSNGGESPQRNIRHQDGQSERTFCLGRDGCGKSSRAIRSRSQARLMLCKRFSKNSSP